MGLAARTWPHQSAQKGPIWERKRRGGKGWSKSIGPQVRRCGRWRWHSC